MLLMAHSHYTRLGQGWVSILRYVLYTLHRDRDEDREPLFFIVPIPVPVPVQVPVPVPVPVPCSVYGP